MDLKIALVVLLGFCYVQTLEAAPQLSALNVFRVSKIDVKTAEPGRHIVRPLAGGAFRQAQAGEPSRRGTNLNPFKRFGVTRLGEAISSGWANAVKWITNKTKAVGNAIVKLVKHKTHIPSDLDVPADKPTTDQDVETMDKYADDVVRVVVLINKYEELLEKAASEMKAFDEIMKLDPEANAEGINKMTGEEIMEDVNGIHSFVEDVVGDAQDLFEKRDPSKMFAHLVNKANKIDSKIATCASRLVFDNAQVVGTECLREMTKEYISISSRLAALDKYNDKIKAEMESDFKSGNVAEMRTRYVKAIIRKADETSQIFTDASNYVARIKPEFPHCRSDITEAVVESAGELSTDPQDCAALQNSVIDAANPQDADASADN